MSSPSFAARDLGFDRRTASSPGPTAKGNADNEGSSDGSVRPMRLKVLYTFDDQSKTNCLARWPQILNIRTAYLDKTTQVGVIPLKTCIQAIVAASPELVAKLGQDYTIYAFDYSEYETPLVGQGMLSWILASASSTPSAPAHQSSTVVTGRVSKNILGLFSNGTQETLEVKLRLVPVPTCLQSEYIESMHKYRDISRMMPGEFDARAWTNFLQANPGILSAMEQSRSQSPALPTGQKEMGIEQVQRLMDEGYSRPSSRPSSRPVSRSQPASREKDSFFNTVLAPADGEGFVRSGSPAPNIQSTTTKTVPRKSLTRTASQASVNSTRARRSSLSSSVDLGYVSNEDRGEDGPAKKRAKVVKADWPARSSFGKQPDSLRVAASTAASVRVFQPIAMRPVANTANSLEEPPRNPTPIPRGANPSLRPQVPAGKSRLGNESFSAGESEYQSPYTFSEDPSKLLDTAMTSPENSRSCSIGLTPAEPGSSPPILRGMTPGPSSPVLPTLSIVPCHEDSGFMSGTLDDLFGDDADNEDRPLDDFDIEIAAQYARRTEQQTGEFPGVNVTDRSEPVLPPHHQEQTDRKALAQSTRQTRSTSRALTRTASSGNFVPSIASDPVRPGASALQRSQTWSGQAQHPASDVPMGSEGLQAPRAKGKGGWDNERRKKAIQTRLESSIAAGEMPPFCDNCGSIETPTWRRAFVKTHCGNAELVVISDEEGAVVGMQALETNEDGSTKVFRIFKKTLLKTDEGFEIVLLCNPCGLWLHNHKDMRPRSYWEKNGARRINRPNKGGGGRKKRDENGSDPGASESASGKFPMSGSNIFNFESTIASTAGQSPDDHGTGTASDQPRDNEMQEPKLPPLTRQRALSAQISACSLPKPNDTVDATAVAALHRAIQSSPGRFLGSRHVPIILDDTSPKSTRRVLFPSPNKASSTTSLDGAADIPSSKRPQSTPTTQLTPPHLPDPLADKENHPPSHHHPSSPDPFADLFNSPQKATSCPTSPTLPHPNHDLFKTPTKTPTPSRHLHTNDLFFSPTSKAFLNPRTPTRTPSRSITTPNRHTSTSHSSSSRRKQALREMTPFTKHLSQLLSETGDLAVSGSPGRFLDFPPLPGLDDLGTGSPGRWLRNEEWDFGNAFATCAGVGLGPSSPLETREAEKWLRVCEDGWGGGFGEGGKGEGEGEGKEEVLVVREGGKEVVVELEEGKEVVVEDEEDEEEEVVEDEEDEEEEVMLVGLSGDGDGNGKEEVVA